MMFEIRVVVLTPGSYNIANERLFYFCIKRKSRLKYACFQTVLSGQCLYFGTHTYSEPKSYSS